MEKKENQEDSKFNSGITVNISNTQYPVVTEVTESLG